MSSEIEPVTDFVNLIDKWKAEHKNEGYDPLPFLRRCSNILESAFVEFYDGCPPESLFHRPLKLAAAECRLSKVLKLLENCKEFNDTLTSRYLKTNESPKNVGSVVIASAKLAFLAGHGYRITGLDSKEYVNVLISWIIYANEPLRTYATGLIDGHFVVIQSSKDKSVKLITTLLKRLWNYIEFYTYKEEECIVLDENQNKSNPRKRKHSQNLNPLVNSKFVVRERDIADNISVNDLGSNGSLVEQTPATIDLHYSLKKPPTDSLYECYTFRLLSCFGGLQEFLSSFHECNALRLVSRYIEMKSDNRLVYHALDFLSKFFCHSKTATEFIELDGIQKLIDVPRSSIGSTRVPLCLYYLACHKDAVEKICRLPAHILRELVEYALRLLECSHDYGKFYIVVFFSGTFSYRNVLSLFDDMNGLRYIVNMICSTQYIINAADGECDPLEDTDLRDVTPQIIYPMCVALSKYFEAQVAFKVRELVTSSPVMKHKHRSLEFVTKYESAKHTRRKHFEYLDFLREFAGKCYNFDLEHWEPIALFQRLDGIPLLLKIIGDTDELGMFVPDLVKACQAALDVLCSVTLSQSCQMTLTECHPHHSIGLRVILNFIAIIRKNNNATYADGVSLNSAITVIINCAEGTDGERRDDSESLEITGSTRYGNKKREARETCWKLIREAHGVSRLISLLDVTRPAQTADETRYLACKALAGLVEHRPLREIVPKLHVLTSKLLNAIPNPVVEDKKELHIQFCINVELLLKRIVKRKASTPDYHWIAVLRTAVDTETRVQCDNEDLLLMIYLSLVLSGIRNNAASSVPEAGKFPDADDYLFAMLESVRKLETFNGFTTEDSKVSESNRSYDIITHEDLKPRHVQRRNPLFTLPPLSAFTPYRCPKPTNKSKPLINFQKRHYGRQGVYHRRYGVGSTGHDLRMIYSRFRPARMIRSTRDPISCLTAVAFSPTDDCALILGDRAGHFHFFKAPKFEDRSKARIFNSTITQIVPSYAGDVMLAVSVKSRRRNCALLAINDTIDEKSTFPFIDYVEFSKTVQDKIVASSGGQAIIYDANTGTAINTYGKDPYDNTYSAGELTCYYKFNRATFSYDDRLVLSSGCLWDVRKPQKLPVHGFDQFNEQISGVFHPNGMEVIINTEVWDMRNFKLIQTVPALDQCQLLFNRNRSVMYAMNVYNKERPVLMSSFRTFDSSNYKPLGCISVEGEVNAIALDDCDRNVAVIERPNSSMSVCRMYEVGMVPEDDATKK